MNEILQNKIEEAAKVFSFNFPSELFHSLQTQHERKLWKDEIEQAYIYGGEDSLQNQWISVEEALPEYDEDVIVTNGKGDYWFSYRPTYDDVIVDRNGFNNPSNLNITHWMPIPQLKGGEK